MTEKIVISEDDMAQLDWSFSTIYEFMMKSGLSVLSSSKLPLVMTYLGEK